MKSLIKKVVLLSVLLPFFYVYAAEPKTPEEALEEQMALEAFDDDFDTMFEEAEDTEAVVTEEPQGPSKASDGTFPLRLSGHLDSNFGLGYIFQQDADDSNKLSGYFTFNNYIYMDARPSPESVIHGTLGISFPGYALGLNECYFDYIIKNKIYFTAGKKGTTWGYPRLLTVSSTATSDKISEFADIGAENTNILADSNQTINGVPTTTFMFRFPLWTGTITGLALYCGQYSQPSFDDMKFAGSIELVFGKTSVNLFARKETKSAGESLGPLFGLEAKRTILGADVYGQGLTRFDTQDKFDRLFKGKFNKTTLQQMVFTGGLYKWWDAKDPAVGFNIEYQGTCSIKSEGETYNGYSLVHRVSFDGGVKRLGPAHNIKIGLELNHNFSDKTGYIKPGVIVSGALPNCDWNTGLKWYYGDTLPKSGKWELGTYLSLALNY